MATAGIILGLSVAAILVAYLFYRSTQGSRGTRGTRNTKGAARKMSEAPGSHSSGPRPPKPMAPPQGGVFATIGNWPVPFAVRYAVQYRNASGVVGPLSDWTHGWYKSNYYSNNILKQFPFVSPNPNSPNSPSSILLWRQFQGQRPQVVAELAYPFHGRHVDMVPNNGV